MIKVTDVAGRSKYVNCELVERIELVPDTMIVLVNGHSMIVRDSPEELISRIIQFKSRIAEASSSLPSQDPVPSSSP